MARNLSHNLKRFVAGVCALLLMAGSIPANTDFGGLFGGSSIVASADYVDGTLVVGGTSVTSTITNGDGWSFDADNNTLTLNGANITQCGGEFSGIHYGGSSPLSIVLVGDNTIDITSTNGDCGILAMNSLINISGTGKLTVKGKSQGIVAYNGVNFNGGTVDVEAKTFAVNIIEGNIIIGNATVTAKATATDTAHEIAHALFGDVINSIAGKGWSNAAGTEGETAIAVSETGRDLAYYRKVQFTATAALSAGTEIYKGDSVLFGQYKQFYTYRPDFKGWLENDTICTLDRISYNSDFEGSSVYEFIFSYNDNDLGAQSSFVIRIPSSQLSITPDGLKVAGGDGTESNPYYFEIIPATKPLAVGTEIYVKDNVLIEHKALCSKQDSDGVASDNKFTCSEDIVGQLSEIKYENGYYKFSFSIPRYEDFDILIKSPQLSNQPIGLKVIGGEGSQDKPFYFKMLFAPLEVTADTPQVIKAGDKFKVDGSVSAVKIGDESPSSINVASGTVFTVSEDTNGLSVAVNDNECSLPFSVGSAKTYHVSYYYGTLIFIENKVYNSELDAYDLNIGDVLAPGASFESSGTYYFQEGNGSYQEYGYGVKFSVVAGGLKQGGTIKNNFADNNKNAFVYDHYDSENDKHYFNQTYIDLGPVVTTPPTAKENLKYNGEEQALVTGGTASDGAKMQYLVVPDGKKPATLIVSGNSLHISVPKVGAVYKPTGDSGIWFENYHIKYNETEYYSDSGDGNVYTYNGKTKLLGLGNNRAELPDDCDAIYVESISGTAITVKAVKAADYAQAAYGDAATATNAGKYQVYYKAVKDDKSSDVGSVTATIAKVDPTVTTAPTAKENLKYNGEAQALVTEGTASAGSTMQYLVVPDGKNPDTEIVSGDQEKIYTPKVGAVYKPTGGIGIYFPNHHIMYNDKEYSSTGGEGNVYYDNGKTIIFGSGNNSAELPDDCDAIYVESISDTAITVKAVKAADYAYGDAATAINAGKYQVYYKAVRSDGVESEADHIDATIAKADPTVTTAPTAKENLKYNGEEQALVTEGTVTGGTMEYGVANEPAEVIEKGEYYELSGNDLTVGKIIKPSDFNGFIFPTGKSVKLLNNNDVFSPYNGSDQSLYDHVNVFLNGITPAFCSDDNTYTEIPNGCDALRIDKINGDTIEVTAVKSSECFEVKTWSATLPKGTDAGDYDVYYRVKGDDNYNDIAPTKIENVKIAEAEITGVTLTANEPTAVEKSGNRVRASFSATVEEGYEIVDYNIIYANDGTVTDTSELTVDKVNGTTIKTFTNSTYSGLLLDKGNGVIAVGYVKVKDSNNNEFYVYTTDLGGKFAELKAKEATTLTANEPTAVEKSGNRVRASFSATVEEGYEIVEYNIIYANDGTVTDTSELTFDKVDEKTIKTFTKSTYSGLLLDKGNGVIAVGYVKVKDSNNNEFYVYTTDLGGKFAELKAKEATTLTANEPTAVVKSGNRVRASFSATVEEGYEIVEYNIIYANDGTVTDTSELTVDKVDGTTIKTFANSTYSGLLLDKGNGVIAVGYVKVKDSNNNEFYVYTTDLGGKFAELKAKEATTLTANEPTAVEKSGNRVRASFSATVEEGYEIVEYNIIYANDGTVTDTSELTFDKVNGTTIKTFANSTYSGLLLDKGNGVIAVGYVKVKDSNDNEFYVYTTDLGGKFAELNAVN